MNKLNRLSGFIIVIAAAFFAAACSSPFGAVDGETGRGGVTEGDDALWAVPNRILYELDERNGEFNRNTDLQVFTSNRGAIQIVPVHLAQIFIIENPGLINESRVPLNSNGRYLFLRPGRKHVEINHRGMTTWYAVEVRGTDYGLGGNGGGGFDIIWF